MRPKERSRIYLTIIDKLWDGSSKVSYGSFLKRLALWRRRLPRARQCELPDPSPATFTRVWQEFCTTHHLHRLGRQDLIHVLLQGISEGAWDGDALSEDVLPRVINYLNDRRIIPPVRSELLRNLRTARRRAYRKRQLNREQVLASAMGTALSDLPLTQRFQVAHKLLRYPSVMRGKAGIAKLDAEDVVRREIEATLAANHIDISVLLAQSNLNEALDFVERRATSTLKRFERREVVRALPLYLAARHRQAVDAILFMFIRLVRILQFRVQATYDERIVDTNRALFERHGREMGALRHAVLEAIETGDPALLRPFRQLLSTLKERGEETSTRRGYYLLLASRGTFARKLAHRLVGISFDGHDQRARATVSALEEVLRFAPFAEPVPRPILRSVHFLDVPPDRLADRRVFETIVLITMADLLWLGRVTSPQSERFGNRWEAVMEVSRDIDEDDVSTALDGARKDLRVAWDSLEDPTVQATVVAKGRLVTKRPPRRQVEEETSRQKLARDRFLTGRHSVSIVDILSAVHRSTGMLDAFKLPKVAHHRLRREQRVSLALAVVLARGMNVGIVQMATLLGRSYTLGRLQNFDDNYVIMANLQQANKKLLDCWDERGLGKTWGSGEGVAADGRSILASERNLLSGYHYRHRRSGVTLYWLVRDDWIATSVGVIGNHEWESWFLLDGLLEPLGGRALHWSTGDTHGQHLALWGLAFLMGKEVKARFRRLSHVKLYHDGASSGLPIRGVQRIRWGIVERAVPALSKLVVAIQEKRITAKDVLRTWNLFDENGMNVMEALRELGKAVRTRFILEYAMSEDLRREIQAGCNRAETWNSFQEAVFWGHGGRMRTNDTRRQAINALCMMLVMNSIVFYNAERYKKIFQNISGSCPVTWEHVRLLGDYRFTLG